MDIWHTCEPDTMGTEGWLGQVIRDIDPNKENVVTGVSFGPSMFRAMALPGVPVATVDDLSNYGLLTGISEQRRRDRILERYKNLYAQSIGTGPVMDFLGQTGLDALKGADVLSAAPEKYSSTVEYADNSVAQKLKGIAQIHLADLGTRIFYCDHGSSTVTPTSWACTPLCGTTYPWGYRTSSTTCENTTPQRTSSCSYSPSSDGAPTTTAPAPTTERQVRPSSSGDRVKGGEYSEYPSTKLGDLQQGDLVPNTDFRGVYSTILEDWLGMDAKPIVGGTFEKPQFIGA